MEKTANTKFYKFEVINNDGDFLECACDSLISAQNYISESEYANELYIKIQSFDKQ
jgi:hypothetical protein